MSKAGMKGQKPNRDKIIMFDSDEAAKFVTGLSGWVDSKGFFFGDRERSEVDARYSGCTHTLCEDCKNPCRKGWLVCDSCRDKREAERYSKLDVVEWDGTTPVYSQTLDKYFFGLEEVEDHLHDSETTGDNLRLVLCEPVFLSKIDTEYWCDDVPDVAEYGDYDFPENILKALDALNAAIGEHGPTSWNPGKKAVRI